LALRSAQCNQCAALEQSRLGKGKVSAAADYDVILHRNVEHPARCYQLLGSYTIIRRRSGISRRMIVNQNDRCRIFRNRFAEHFARMNER